MENYRINIDDFVNKNTENKIIFSVGNNLKTVNRFGEIENTISLDSDIISLSESNSNIAVLTHNSINIINENSELTRVKVTDYSEILFFQR